MQRGSKAGNKAENIKQTFQQLCSRDSPVGAHLFGDNLTEQVSKIKDQGAVKLVVTKPPFRTTTCFSPYNANKGDSPSWKKKSQTAAFLGRRQPRQLPPDPTYHSAKQYRTTNHHAPQTHYSHKRGGGEEEVADPKAGTEQEEITSGSTPHNLPEACAPPHGLLHTVPTTLSSRLNSWECISSDQTVLVIVEIVWLDFSSLPFHIRCPYPIPFQKF